MTSQPIFDGKLFTKKQLEDLHSTNVVSILTKCFDVKAGHIGGSLSLSLILLPILQYNLSNNESLNLRLVLSKGHASLGLYSLLHTLEINSIPYDNYCSLELGSFHGHTCKHADPIIAHSTGSLGHGLPFAFGMALGEFTRFNSSTSTIMCILGDGELQEGTFHEIYLHLAQNSHLNLKIIIDDNSSIDTNTLKCKEYLQSLALPGYALVDACSFASAEKLIDLISRPGVQFIHCLTSKYFGLSSHFHDPKWHAGVPTKTELELMLTTLNTSLS